MLYWANRLGHTSTGEFLDSCLVFFLMVFLLHDGEAAVLLARADNTDAEEPNTTGTVCKRRGMPVTCVCGFGFLCNCVGCRAWAPFSAVVQSQPSSASQGRRPAALHVRGDKAGGGAATGGDKPPRTKISPGPSEGADSGGVSGVDGARLSGAAETGARCGDRCS